ncbi:S8 family serine peptidase [Saccharothrix obliqua]|uniref:S8 family serine peptidase n=1 Tax=Saccharothrix obliqua TaxID=2861747 RepID=UPI001C5E7CE7|nr:S8 family serine peptidase [Saccharothrix obliqua]MBW4715534.1 S8 family serine peptidase [Saccharothrix obliqua]
MGGRGIAVVVAALLLAGVTPGAALAQTIQEQQWHLGALGVGRAHELATGEGVVVAVVDSGVDDTGPDLAGAVLPGTGFANARGTDGTEDADGHGTAMAALIAGRGVAGGALGIAPGARVLPVSLGSEDGRFSMGAVAAGITWAVDQGADVINLSLTSAATLTPDLLRAVNYAFEHDIVVVAGTGNAGEHHVGAPANIRGVIAVSGTEQGNALWSSSNTGPETVLAAPAREIVTAVPVAVSATGYAAVDGTSAATALVSGVAALVRSRHPGLDAGNVVHRLIATATDLGPPGVDDTSGYGQVDPVAALTADLPAVDRNPLAPPPLPTTTPPPPADDTRAAPPGPDASGDTRTAVALGGLLLVAAAVTAVAVPLGRRRRTEPRVTELPPPGDDFWRPR